MKTNTRRHFFKKISISLASFSLSGFSPTALETKASGKDDKKASEVYLTTGFKTAEVNSNSVLLWTRLCSQQKPNQVIHERALEVFRHPIDFDENMPIEEMDGGVKGAGGYVRATLTNGSDEITSEWYAANSEHDFTVEIPFANLTPETAYQIIWEAKSSNSEKIFEFAGSFQTAPDIDSQMPVQLVTSTCQYFWSYDNDKRGFDTYDSMRKLKPDFFVHTGDYVYYDKPGPLAKTIEKARHKWHAMDSWLSLIDFFKRTPVYMMKDDHDLLKDDVYPASDDYGQLTFDDGLKIWNENVPLWDKPYRTFRWGKDLQIWLVEGREYRSSNLIEDSPQKTIWGTVQKEWFQNTVQASDATFKILFSPTPVVGPDRDRKTDNHANKSFQREGDWLRDYLSTQKDMFVVNGDRHWQYVSEDKKTGLMEFGSGPVSDAHAQGWNQEDMRPEHRFLRVKGGFMGVKVSRENGLPEIVFTHYDTKGTSVHEEKFAGT